MGFFSKRLKDVFEIAVVNEPPEFEPLKFYCTLNKKVKKMVHFIMMIMEFCEQWSIVYDLTNSDAGGIRTR